MYIGSLPNGRAYLRSGGDARWQGSAGLNHSAAERKPTVLSTRPGRQLLRTVLLIRPHMLN